MPDAAITDDHASAAYGSEVEAWGKRGWGQVAAMCRWASDHGMVLPFTCPAAGR
ncbi:hypothetical protein [Sphingomonas oryzagri]|uniref:Uncharacterized protein n=1 Tax=Sphingomonas oryzagri TaxID=3042314 RepID=A0ABT6N5R3_9SPHN|nr:hypothetical protein [Sphingomonas oryzagri]MDH7640454.1 hypothetical protein [Sphingomonas oryzagri]